MENGEKRRPNGVNITRREALKRTSALAGGVIISPLVVGLFQGCSPSDIGTGSLIFSKEQTKTLTAIIDTMIPETDTPSASQAGVLTFMEEVIFRNSSQETQHDFLMRFDTFMKIAEQDLGKPFYEAETEKKHQFLYDLHQTAYAQGDFLRNTDLPDFLKWLRYLCVTGYFRSKSGATQVLRYAEMPGPYRGCVPFEEVGRTWAT